MAAPQEQYWRGTNAIGDTTWGDGGKGKLADEAGQYTHVVVRVAGGANAGHTVKNEHGTFAFHLVPSGIFNANNRNYLANGVLVDPVRLSKEIADLKSQNVEVGEYNLGVSELAHGVFAWHKVIDGVKESNRGAGKIGTTGSGIGPAASQRAQREGMRMKDFLLSNEEFEKRVDKEISEQERYIKTLAGEPLVSELADAKFKKYSRKKLQKLAREAAKQQFLDRDQILQELRAARETIAPLIGNVTKQIWEAKDRGENILLELAQGQLLDPIFGSYPYVTSTHPGLAGVTASTGIQGREIDKAVGVVKAYATRVGGGPMPTELNDEIGEKIREIGNEYGATTGRPRRVGWLDLPAIRYGIQSGGFDRIAITKGDVLDQFEVINAAVGYVIDEKEYYDIETMDPEVLERADPILVPMKGWRVDTSGARTFEALPVENKEYILFIQEELGVPVDIISVGPDREQTIYKAS